MDLMNKFYMMCVLSSRAVSELLCWSALKGACCLLSGGGLLSSPFVFAVFSLFGLHLASPSQAFAREVHCA